MTLRDEIIAELDRRERLALAARGPLVAMTEQARAYWETHDSADALRRYAHLRQLLGDHDAWSGDVACRNGVPCRPLERIAESLGIDTRRTSSDDHRPCRDHRR